MNYIYKFATRGLCSELNTLLGFYESVVGQNCRIYIDASTSMYFKGVSIQDVFSFPDIFVDKPHPDSTIIHSGEYVKSSPAGRAYETSLTKKQCAGLFSHTDDFQKQINVTISKLSLPLLYNCFHIRRGDKVNEKLAWTSGEKRGESLRFEFKDYINSINSSSIKTNNLFVMTDDYRCIKEGKSYLAEIGSSNKIFSLVKPNQSGHSSILAREKEKVYSQKELVQFFSEIEIAKQSQQFIGTETSNIFRYIKNQCVGDVKLISLD